MWASNRIWSEELIGYFNIDCSAHMNNIANLLTKSFLSIYLNYSM